MPRRMTLAERLAARSELVSSGCREWRGGVKGGSGYGAIWHNGKMDGAHRVACALAHGEPPPGKNMALHTCHNRLCVNPDHLYWGDAVDNARDMKEAGRAFNGRRARTGCPRGHEYSDENTYWHRGWRDCKECQRERVREFRARRGT
jgi:hypothetical protein